MDDEAAAQRAWELEMEAAVESRGRTRSRSILAAETSADHNVLSNDSHDNDDDDSADHSRASRSSRRRYHDHEDGDEQRYQLAALEREIDIVDGGHDPTWSRSDSGGSAGDMRLRARSFSARKHAEMERDADDESRRSTGRRRSCSFSSLEQRSGAVDDPEDTAEIVKRATSLSKIYLVGSAPVDVSKLQDDSKIVGVKKVEVVQPTGALSAKALDALSEGLQLSVDNSLMLKDASATTQLTEEQLEEQKMEEEEDHKLKAEKLSTRKTLTARASMFKAKVFKTKAPSLTSGASAGALLKASSPALDSFRASGNDASLRAGASRGEKAETDSAAPVVPKKRHKLKLLLLGDSGTCLLRGWICLKDL